MQKLYAAWMTIALAIGRVTTPVVMAALYVLVIVPVALAFKLVGRDSMRRKLDPRAASYWEDYPRADDPASYIRPF